MPKYSKIMFRLTFNFTKILVSFSPTYTIYNPTQSNFFPSEPIPKVTYFYYNKFGFMGRLKFLNVLIKYFIEHKFIGPNYKRFYLKALP